MMSFTALRQRYRLWSLRPCVDCDEVLFWSSWSHGIAQQTRSGPPNCPERRNFCTFFFVPWFAELIRCLGLFNFALVHHHIFRYLDHQPGYFPLFQKYDLNTFAGLDHCFSICVSVSTFCCEYRLSYWCQLFHLAEEVETLIRKQWTLAFINPAHRYSAG